jgi:hypothetical protein
VDVQHIVPDGLIGGQQYEGCRGANDYATAHISVAHQGVHISKYRKAGIAHNGFVRGFCDVAVIGSF